MELILGTMRDQDGPTMIEFVPRFQDWEKGHSHKQSSGMDSYILS